MLKWRGKTEAVSFNIQIPSNFRPGNVIGRVTVSQDSIPVGRITFKLRVRSKNEISAFSMDHKPNGKATRYRYAFISYAARDRMEVIRRTQMLAVLKIDFFHDILSLNPGDRWKQEIYKHIDLADVFFLFWSKAARASKWVRKEVEYAVARKKGKDEFPPDILPIPIQGPPIVKPPKSLEYLHFNDKMLFFLQGCERL